VIGTDETTGVLVSTATTLSLSLVRLCSYRMAATGVVRFVNRFELRDSGFWTLDGASRWTSLGRLVSFTRRSGEQWLPGTTNSSSPV
jgi:hypothetical protein